MKNNLIVETKNAILELKKEIIDKQKILNDLITEYQELSGIEVFDDFVPELLIDDE